MLRMAAEEVLQVAANRAGFTEVDLVDNDLGHVKVDATMGHGSKRVTFSVSGKNIHDVVEKFLTRFSMGDSK